MKAENALRPLIIGEVLFDCFPAHRVLGGAPFNVAWNLRGLGIDPLVVTAIGKDEPGAEVQQAMQRWGLDESALQIDAQHATGRVEVKVCDGEPSYQFWEDVAFDHIASPPDTVAEQRLGLLYHGSLVFRSPDSRRTILELKRSLPCPVFVDINVRQPYFDLEWAAELLTDAEHVKLNLDELSLLSGEALAGDLGHLGDRGWDACRRSAAALQQRYQIGNLWLTAGAEGAAWLGSAGEFEQVPAAPVPALIDTVGAGDAFAAMAICGILAGTRPPDSLRRAAAFAAQVCGIRGAVVADRSFYPQQEIA